MDKREIYEHLARIYLDASSRKKKKIKKPVRLNYVFFVLVILALTLTTVLSRYFWGNKKADTRVALLLQNDVAKINFNFNPAKKEIYTINLNNLNLNRFNTIAFALKKSNYHDSVALKVELANTFREKSGVYIKYIPCRWQDYEIKLSNFKGISDWSAMTNLSFTIEEWNTREKHGVVYIDNLRLLR